MKFAFRAAIRPLLGMGSIVLYVATGAVLGTLALREHRFEDAWMIALLLAILYRTMHKDSPTKTLAKSVSALRKDK